MADLMKPFARGRAMVRTPPVLARYLDDLAQADRVAGDWDALAAAARGMDDALPPRGPVPPGDYTAAIDSMLPAVQPEPFADALLRNDRTRALIDSRLNRLSPEQMPGSLGLVGRQFAADQAAARAATLKAAEDRKTLAAMAALGAAGAGAFAGRVMQEAGERDRLAPLERDMQVADFVRSSIDDLRIEDDSPIEPPMTYDPEARVEDLFRDDYKVTLDMDTPDQASAMAPGPAAPVGVNADLEDLPGPQARSVRALIGAGIPAGRAMDIIQGRANMSPEEYRMVTGGRR